MTQCVEGFIICQLSTASVGHSSEKYMMMVMVMMMMMMMTMMMMILPRMTMSSCITQDSIDSMRRKIYYLFQRRTKQTEKVMVTGYLLLARRTCDVVINWCVIGKTHLRRGN